MLCECGRRKNRKDSPLPLPLHSNYHSMFGNINKNANVDFEYVVLHNMKDLSLYENRLSTLVAFNLLNVIQILCTFIEILLL